MLIFVFVYSSLAVLITAYGVHRYWLALGSLVSSPKSSAIVSPPPRPRVLVQLPIFNEPDLFRRLIDSACSLRWEPALLEIQVLDDSNDGTSGDVARLVNDYARRGVNIVHVRRSNRRGYKAGALEEGLAQSSAEYVAIFDADFIIPDDFLLRTIPSFSEEKVGMVQTRWGYTNAETSWLTSVQATMLDGHFRVEHLARSKANRFFNFNGTAGVWRVAAIESAGGWKSETITEDLELSIRAWLAGWRFRYLDDIVVPSDLPESMKSYKLQQNRWVSGSIDTAVRLLLPILRSSLGLKQKIDLTFYLTGNCVYLLLLMLILMVPPAVLARVSAPTIVPWLWIDLPFFLFATLSVIVFYSRSQPSSRRSLRFYCARLPQLMALGLGMTLHNSRAVFKGLFGRARVFERTPKGSSDRQVESSRSPGRSRSAGRVDWLICGEGLIACYLGASLLVAIKSGSIVSVPFLSLFVLGYLYVFARSFQQLLARR